MLIFYVIVLDSVWTLNTFPTLTFIEDPCSDFFWYVNIADSRLLGQTTKQTANCDTAGAGSPVSGSCNENKRIMLIMEYQLPFGHRETLLINELCFGVSCPLFPFNINRYWQQP